MSYTPFDPSMIVTLAPTLSAAQKTIILRLILEKETILNRYLKYSRDCYQRMDTRPCLLSFIYCSSNNIFKQELNVLDNLERVEKEKFAQVRLLLKE